MSNKTLEEIKALITKEIIEEKADNAIFEELKKALRPFIGKPYTKHLETAVKKHFGNDYSVYLERISSLIYMNIKGPWPNQSEYRLNDGHRILIGYSETPTYQEGTSEEKHSGINYFSSYYGDAALERIKQNEKMLKSKKLERMALAIDLINEGKKMLKNEAFSSYLFPSRHVIDKKFNLN